MPDVLRQLDADWRREAHGPRARRALMRWKATQPALRQLESFDDLLVMRERNPEGAREMLAALMSMAPTDYLAARVLLQALVPGLIRLSLTVGHGDWSPLNEMLPVAWERIRTYPVTRPGSVAANVLGDVGKIYRRHRAIDTPCKRHQQDWQQLDTTDIDSDEAVAARMVTVPSAEEAAMSQMVLDDLVAAQQRGIISESDLRLIVETRILGTRLSEIARREGYGWNTMASWRFRAERRLRERLLAG